MPSRRGRPPPEDTHDNAQIGAITEAKKAATPISSVTRNDEAVVRPSKIPRKKKPQSGALMCMRKNGEIGSGPLRPNSFPCRDRGNAAKSCRRGAPTYRQRSRQGKGAAWLLAASLPARGMVLPCGHCPAFLRGPVREGPQLRVTPFNPASRALRGLPASLGWRAEQRSARPSAAGPYPHRSQASSAARRHGHPAHEVAVPTAPSAET